jgi:hypothetical protein
VSIAVNLPDRALGAVQSADEKTVDPDQLARTGAGDVRFGRRVARRLIGRPVAGHEREALGARVEPVPQQRLVDPVGADDQPAPFRACQAGRDPPRPVPGMSQRERHNPLLDQHRKLVGHPRPATLAWTQHLQPVAVDLGLPAVIGRAMHPERATRMRDRRARGQIKQLQAIAEQHVILRHAAQCSLRLAVKGA